MSSPRYGWWSYAKNMARRYPHRVNENEYAAVAAAIRETECMANAAERLKVIRLVLLEGRCNLEGAALRVPCSQCTAQRYHRDFLRAVGRNFHCEKLC